LNKSVEIDEILHKLTPGYVTSRTTKNSYCIFQTTNIERCKTLIDKNQLGQRDD